MMSQGRNTATQRSKSPGRGSGRRLVLTLAPVQWDNAQTIVGALPYESKEQLDALREKNQTTHVFRRDGANSLLAVAVAPGAPILGEPREVDLGKNLGLVAALLRN